MDPRKRQTATASPAEPGELPVLLGGLLVENEIEAACILAAAERQSHFKARRTVSLMEQTDEDPPPNVDSGENSLVYKVVEPRPATHDGRIGLTADGTMLDGRQGDDAPW
jgi:hypothetical protein